MKKILTERASALERATGFVKRSTAELRGAVFAQAVVFGWLANPQASYSQLRHVIGSLGVHVSRQAVEQRFDEHAVALMRQLFEEATGQVIQSESAVPDLLARFAAVVLQDGTRIGLPEKMAEQWPGSGGGNAREGCLRVQVRLNYGSGHWLGVWIQHGHQAEPTGAAVETTLPDGALWNVDSGYLNLARLRHLDQTERFFLIPPRADLVFFDPRGVRCSLKQLLDKQSGEWVDLDGKAGSKRTPAGASGGLPPPRRAGPGTSAPSGRASEFASQRRAASQCPRSRPLAPAQANTIITAIAPFASIASLRKKRELLGWTLLLTNVPREKLSKEEVLVLARCRGPIELLWKWGKQLVKVDTGLRENPERILTEIFAKLLGMLLTQWITLIECWPDPRPSLVKAYQVVQWMAPVLALSLAGVLEVECAVQRSAVAMRRGCQVQPRRKKPATFQFLAAPQLIKT